jgi:hypothetical protein
MCDNGLFWYGSSFFSLLSSFLYLFSCKMIQQLPMDKSIASADLLE